MSKKTVRGELDSLSLMQLKKSSMALDDLVWTLQKVDLQQLKSLSNVFRSILVQDEMSSSVAQTYKSDSPNRHFLIGVLPKLFQDKVLFPQNEDIADFASSALKLEMSRTEKRSRYEIIGKVVCETDTLDEAGLTSLVQALEKLVGNKDTLAKMVEKKRSGSFSWNETLQELLRG